MLLKYVLCFCAKVSRKGLTGRFLSRSRFLFMAAAQLSDFADTVIAEMRGVSRRRWSLTVLAVVSKSTFLVT